ncbi:MAG: transglycosylase domain-containing protein, partial [Flavobacteriaceae bacterium]
MSKTKKKTSKKRNYKKFILAFWLLFLTGFTAVVGVFGIAALGYLGPMPPLEQLENPKTNLATQIFSSDGEVLGKFYFNDNRTPITYDELPQNIVEALIATEDERYYDHAGIDWRGTLRAVFYLGKKGGASTITQQLARQLFVGVRSRNKKEALLQKIKEWVLSVQLERRYTKNEIVAMYLNIYDFGYNADGVRSAAKIYFDTTPQALTLEQSATLVGMLKN